MMNNPLVTHAIHNVWCATNQDFQHHIKLARITPERGVLRQYPVMWDYVAVPKTPTGRDYFHFYQIGNLPTKTFDFLDKENEWVNYLQLNEENNILIDVYLASGGVVPRDHIWVTRLYNNNILVAIKNNTRIDYGICNKTYFNGVRYKERFTLDSDQAIIRFYSNAYFDNVDYIKNAVDPKMPIRVHYKLIKNNSDFVAFMQAAGSVESEFGSSGLGVYYEDGIITERPLGFSKRLEGKYLGFMWDESFQFQKYFRIKQLPAFISEKHRGVRKYLLVVDDKYGYIDYHDDIDFYIVNHETGRGIYVNRHGGFGISMITHNSYSIDAELIENYITAHEFLGSIDSCSIRMMVRHGGRQAGLFNQKNRIEELYRLPYSEIIQAHVNTPSLVPAWRAAALENSSYVKLMSAPTHLITKELVVDAYGYNGLCTQFANPRIDVIGNEIIVPEIARIPDKTNNLGRRSIFCYNEEGLMIGYYQNTSLSPSAGIPADFKTTKTVECFNAVLSEDEVSVWVNNDVVTKDLEQYGFRCYVSAGDLNGIYNEWEDVTGSSLYTYTPGDAKTPASIKWNWSLLTQADLYPAVKCNKEVHVYKWSKKENEVYDGCLEIEVKATQLWSNKKVKKSLGVAPACVDVFANGLSLVNGIDYYMQWPRIVITNRDINRSKVINLVVRSYGFADPRTDKPFEIAESGFVKSGMLSINGVYDIRNDKCVRVVVNNRLCKINDLNFGEQLNGRIVEDGKPYGISNYIIPLENLLQYKDTWTLYKETIDIDKTVSDYLTPRIKENPVSNPVVHVTRWPVISPVVSSLLHSFKSGHNFDKITPDNYTTEDVEKWFKPFKWLLTYDPAYHNVDENYFRIEPHALNTVMQVTQKQYEFIECIIKLYLNDRVDLSVNVKIGE